MKKLKCISGILLCIAVLSFGCSKKEDPAPAGGQSKKEMLTAKIWIYTSIKSRSSETILDCQKENMYQFTSDEKYTYTDSAPVCIDNKPGTGKWSLNSDETILSLVDNNGTMKYNLQTVNSSTLVLTVDLANTTDKTVHSFVAK